MKISYAITVCNELEEVKRLIEFLYLNKRQEDEICVLVDKPKASKELLFELYKYETTRWIILKESEFKGHFVDWKNQLMDVCSGSYIFQIDADEVPHINLVQNLSTLLEENQLIDTTKIFKTKTKKLNNISVEFDFFSVADRPERPLELISYDEKKKIIYIPLVNNNGKVSNKNILYQLKGGYFEFIGFENGKRK